MTRQTLTSKLGREYWLDVLESIRNSIRGVRRRRRRKSYRLYQESLVSASYREDYMLYACNRIERPSIFDENLLWLSWKFPHRRTACVAFRNRLNKRTNQRCTRKKNLPRRSVYFFYERNYTFMVRHIRILFPMEPGLNEKSDVSEVRGGGS